VPQTLSRPPSVLGVVRRDEVAEAVGERFHLLDDRAHPIAVIETEDVDQIRSLLTSAGFDVASWEAPG
jgi:hypothetical protein